MAHMCPMQGCKEKEGMCMHEKAMLAMLVIAAVAVIVAIAK